MQLNDNLHKPPSSFKIVPRTIPEDECHASLPHTKAEKRLIDPDRLLVDIRKGLEEFKKREALSSLIGSPRKQERAQHDQPVLCDGYRGLCTPPVSDSRQQPRSLTPSPCRNGFDYRAGVQQSPPGKLDCSKGHPESIQTLLPEMNENRNEVYIAPASGSTYSPVDDRYPSGYIPASNATYEIIETSQRLYPEQLDCDQGPLGCEHGSCSVDPFSSPPRHFESCDEHPVGRVTPNRTTPASRAGTSFFAISPTMSDALSFDAPTDLGHDLSSIPSALDLSQALCSELQSEQGEACAMTSTDLKDFGGKNPFYATAAKICRGLDMSQFRGAKVL
jgi:hypothetical protein